MNNRVISGKDNAFPVDTHDKCRFFNVSLVLSFLFQRAESGVVAGSCSVQKESIKCTWLAKSGETDFFTDLPVYEKNRNQKKKALLPCMNMQENGHLFTFYAGKREEKAVFMSACNL